MKLEIETEMYNARRYGRPYIAVMNFSESKGIPTWGFWVGEATKGTGYPGLLVVEAEVGDIVMKGQKDHRGNNSAPHYYIVEDQGSLKKVSKVDAYKAWQTRKAVA